MKSFLQNTGLVIAALAFSCVGAEFILRAIPNSYRQAQVYYAEKPEGVAYRALESGLFTLVPGQEVRQKGMCYSIESVRTNSEGFRDVPWQPDKKGFRIAVIGDSFMQAVQVGDPEHLSARLSRLLGIEVLNAGIGGYSTATELEAYRRLVRPYRPDLVVLAFFLGNDVKGNSCTLDPSRAICAQMTAEGPSLRLLGGQTQLGGPTEAGARPANLEIGVWNDFKDFGRRHLVLYQLLHDAKMITLGALNQARGAVDPEWDLYLRTEPREWRDAWALTRYLLSSLKAEIEQDGAKLIVLAIPENFTFDPSWRAELRYGAGTAVSADMDPAGPSERLAGIVRDLDIPLLDLGPPLLGYRERMNLPYPFFANSCDGHWNALTHILAAEELASFLARKLLIPGADREALRARRDRVLATPPKGLLGNSAYRAVYHGGIYRGLDNAPLLP